MYKIIAAFDGLDYSESTEEYAIYLAGKMKAHLVGVFLDDFSRLSFSVTEVAAYSGTFDENFEERRLKDRAERDLSVACFEKDCQASGINYSVHRDRNIAIQELLHESIYADLLIIDPKESLNRFEENPPARFIRDLLADVQCPVLLVPSKFEAIEKNVFLYDGSPSCLHAIKMFSYLFPCFKELDTEVISVKSDDESMHLPDNHLMKEFMKRHYSKTEYVVLKGIAEDKIVSYLRHQKENAIVALGAYRRSRVSRWFKPSMADVLSGHLQLPLFVSHYK